MHLLKRWVGVMLTTVLAAVLAAAPSSAETDDPNVVTTTEVASALAGVPGLLAESDPTVTADATSGEFTLPGAPAQGKSVAPGVVAYPGSNGFANAVQALPGGTKRLLTVITSPAAPQQFTYKAQAPFGGSIQLADNGGAVVLDHAGQPTVIIAKPWAVDAKGQQVTTYYTTDGSSLTQVVKHGQGTIYPVVADPTTTSTFWEDTIWYSKEEVRAIGNGGAISFMEGYAVYWCAKLRSPQAIAACGGALAAFSNTLLRTFDRAAEEDKCVWITFSRWGPLRSWGRYSC